LVLVDVPILPERIKNGTGLSFTVKLLCFKWSNCRE
jgi:hypothetical protein